MGRHGVAWGGTGACRAVRRIEVQPRGDRRREVKRGEHRGRGSSLLVLGSGVGVQGVGVQGVGSGSEIIVGWGLLHTDHHQVARGVIRDLHGLSTLLSQVDVGFSVSLWILWLAARKRPTLTPPSAEVR